MKYLLVWADYMGTGLRDEFADGLEPEGLGLDQVLCDQLSGWVAKYGQITPLSSAERAQKKHEIDALDYEGILIARTIKSALDGDAKVTYFSEGLLKKLPI